MRAWLVAVLVACGGAPAPSTMVATPVTVAVDYAKVCGAIAADLETLTREYPQLGEYRAVDHHGCEISYGYHTHQATHAGGWAAAVPNPDPDGIWFYIGVWDPQDPEQASRQINTQPVLPPWRIGDWHVTFLILEGEQTKPAAAAIIAILHRHGMKDS